MTRLARRLAGWALPALATVALACKPYTPRPWFSPVNGAAREEVFLEVPAATEVLADIFRTDSMPVIEVEKGDGYIETAWFDAATRQATRARPLGPDVVRVRAWIDPARRGHSFITIETVYRPIADPALDQRDLDTEVPPDHPVGKRMTQIVTELAKLYQPVSAK